MEQEKKNQQKQQQTFGDLPQRDACIKLMQVSFSTPQKNLAVYKFCQKVFELRSFYEAERTKLLKKYGDPTENEGEFLIPKCNVDSYNRELRKLLETEVEEELVLGLTEDDFSDDNCHYPADKNLWLNAGEIMTFLRF